MDFDRKGDIGFMEAMMSMMVVILTLTAFIGAFSIHMAHENAQRTIFEEDFQDSFSISGKGIVGDPTEAIIRMMEFEGFKGIVVRCSVPGMDSIPDRMFSAGEVTKSIESTKRLVTLGGDDGRSIPAIIEVAICT